MTPVTLPSGVNDLKWENQIPIMPGDVAFFSLGNVTANDLAGDLSDSFKRGPPSQGREPFHSDGRAGRKAL